MKSIAKLSGRGWTFVAAPLAAVGLVAGCGDGSQPVEEDQASESTTFDSEVRTEQQAIRLGRIHGARPQRPERVGGVAPGTVTELTAGECTRLGGTIKIDESCPHTRSTTGSGALEGTFTCVTGAGRLCINESSQSPD